MSVQDLVTPQNTITNRWSNLYVNSISTNSLKINDVPLIVSSGTYMPTYTLTAGSVTSFDPVMYTIIGQIVTVTGYLIMTLPTSGSSFILALQMPPNTNCDNMICAAQLVGSRSGAGMISVCSEANIIRLSQIQIVVVPMNGVSFPGVAQGTTKINYIATYRNTA